MKLANEAIDACRRQAWSTARRQGDSLRWVKHTCWALVKDPGRALDRPAAHARAAAASPLGALPGLGAEGALRDVYRLRELGAAHQFLDRWLAWACRCRIPSFVRLSRTILSHRDGILAAELGLSNSKLEGLNSKIRLIRHRGYEHHSPAALISMIYLCCGGITVELPTRR